MKVIFLDVDGVLNRCGFSAQGLETPQCELLSYIIRMTGAFVVVSSTWRLYPLSMERLNALFQQRGIKCLGVTEDMSAPVDHSVLITAVPRHLEISEWLKHHPDVENYAIIDDGTDADDGTGRFFRTQSFTGLTDSIADRIIAHLGKLPESERETPVGLVTSNDTDL